MWPKVMAQLIDLLPHATRLMPAMERFFQGKGAVPLDDESRKAVEDLRADLAKSVASDAVLHRELGELGEKVAEAAADARAAKAAAEANDERLQRMQKRFGTQLAMLAVSLLANVVAVLLLIVLFLHR